MTARATTLPRVIALALLVLAAGCPRRTTSETAFRFTPIDDGVEYARFRVDAPSEGPAFEGHAFRVDLSRASLRALPAGGPTTRRDVATIVRALPRVVATNASFFAEDGRAMGLIVDEGSLRGRRRAKAWGALVVKDGRARVMAGRDVDLTARPDLVLQGTPRLVDGGRTSPLKPAEARRTVACLRDVDAAGARELVLVVTSPAELSALALVLARDERDGGLGCVDALNFDGGPSTQLIARLGDFSVDVKGGDGVPNALAVIPGRPPASRAPLDAGGRALDAGVELVDAGEP